MVGCLFRVCGLPVLYLSLWNNGGREVTAVYRQKSHEAIGSAFRWFAFLLLGFVRCRVCCWFAFAWFPVAPSALREQYLDDEES